MRAGLIKMTTSGISTALSIASTVVLARLLTPEEFGLLAMVTAFTEFARSFREIGLGSATVQREEINHEEVSSLFWINLGVGVTIMVAFVCLSPVIAWFYGDSRLLHICMVLSSVFLFGGLTVQHRALLERQMKFGYLGTINMISAILSICVAILLALHGSSVWALVFRDIAFAVCYAIGVWLLCGWIPSLPKQKTDVRSSLRFGAGLSAFDIIQNFTRSLDRVLIGRFCGATVLGLYTKALQLAMMPIEQVRGIFWDVGFSPLSALQSDHERFRRLFSRMLSVMTFLYMPFVVFLAIKSEDVIRLILGEAWLSAAPLFRIFAIAGFVRPIMGMFQLVMISCGNTKRVVVWGVINGVSLVIAFAIGIRWGAFGIAYSYAFMSYALLIWSFWYCFKDTPINAPLVIKTISLPVVLSCGAGIILVILLPHIPNTNPFISIISSISIILTAYLGICLCIPKGRQNLAEFWSYRAELLSRK